MVMCPISAAVLPVALTCDNSSSDQKVPLFEKHRVRFPQCFLHGLIAFRHIRRHQQSASRIPVHDVISNTVRSVRIPLPGKQPGHFLATEWHDKPVSFAPHFYETVVQKSVSGGSCQATPQKESMTAVNLSDSSKVTRTALVAWMCNFSPSLNDHNPRTWSRSALVKKTAKKSECHEECHLMAEDPYMRGFGRVNQGMH